MEVTLGRPGPALACNPLSWQEARWNTGPGMKRLPFNPRQPSLHRGGRGRCEELGNGQQRAAAPGSQN